MIVAATAHELAPCHHGVVVPTMGGLHEGHAALIRRAASEADGRPVVVTIFVNPTQFNDPRDFERYPRTFDDDLALCQRCGATAVLAPSEQEVYPDGRSAGAVELPPVAVTPGLEDRFRPGHFAGVCQVVRRLFELTRASAAVFGEKDWQQLQVVRAMTSRERLPVRIIPHPTVRDPDGLAMSSRNRLLRPQDRAAALGISRALRAAQLRDQPAAAEAALRDEMQRACVEVEYAAVRDAQSLQPLPPSAPRNGAARALAAGRVGAVRLIDNDAW